MKLVGSAVLGGLVLFAWSSISWMVLPWHHATFKTFKFEPAVMLAMKTGAQGSGVYQVPGMKEDPSEAKKRTGEPSVFLVYNEKGYGNMGTRMALALAEDMLTALLAALFLARCSAPGFGARVVHSALLGLFAGLAVHVPNSIWWGHSYPFTLVAVVDLVIGWTLAGAVMAMINKEGR